MTTTVLITRPDPNGFLLADELRNRWGCGVRLVVSPVLQIDVVGALPDLREVSRLIFTSKHGVAAFVSLSARRDLACYAVGPATAQAARDAGFTVAKADGDVEALFDRIMADGPSGHYLHIRGEHSAGDLASRLTAAGRPASESVVYRQAAQPLNEEAQTCLGRECPVILPLFSPRSAQLVFSQINPVAPVLVAALSNNVALSVPIDLVNSLHIATRPDAEAMFVVMDTLLAQAKLLEGAKRAQ